ncbi:MAG: hypothetical protein NVS9B4_15600 [Candidatus Acidiferrum sp.]
MPLQVSRRGFIVGTSVCAAASSIPFASLLARERLYPPRDLAYFDAPISPAPSEIHFGYASITWDGKDRQAIEDVASLGFHGIQLRANVIKEFGSPAELRDLLEKNKLKLVALSSGGVRIDPTVEAEQIALHVEHAKFVRDVGGMYLQVTDERPKNRAITAADYARLGRLITEIGKRTADLGISLGYHNHMGSLGERPEEVDQILQAADPRYAKLELDVAHYLQGGGDPAKAIEKYRDRLLFLHIKDVERIANSSDPKRSYRFVELGRGRVNLPEVFRALHDVNFRGWAIVELDQVPGAGRTPKDSAAISKKYLEEKIGVTV